MDGETLGDRVWRLSRPYTDGELAELERQDHADDRRFLATIRQPTQERDEARERVRVLEDAVMRSDSLLSLIWHRGYLPWAKQAELREEFNEVLPMLRRFRKPARAALAPTEDPPGSRDSQTHREEQT